MDTFRFAWLDGVPAPRAGDAGAPAATIDGVAAALVGRCIAHATRAHDHWHMTTRGARARRGGKDYDFGSALAMHTDHSAYSGAPGFVAFMHQIEGASETKLADGLAVTAAFARAAPAAFELLATTPVAHGVRHRLYDPDGAPRDVDDAAAPAAEFELIHDAPVIGLWPGEEGDTTTVAAAPPLAKLVHSETKRSILNGVAPDKLPEFLRAYDEFCALAEDPRFCLKMPWPEGRVLVFNNHRLLHGRARITTPQRTLQGCYNTRAQAGHRHRLMRMRLVQERLALDAKWTSRLNDAALGNLARHAGLGA